MAKYDKLHGKELKQRVTDIIVSAVVTASLGGHPKKARRILEGNFEEALRTVAEDKGQIVAGHPLSPSSVGYQETVNGFICPDGKYVPKDASLPSKSELLRHCVRHGTFSVAEMLLEMGASASQVIEVVGAKGKKEKISLVAAAACALAMENLPTSEEPAGAYDEKSARYLVEVLLKHGAAKNLTRADIEIATKAGHRHCAEWASVRMLHEAHARKTQGKTHKKNQGNQRAKERTK
jgi:ribosomal protein L10